MVTRYLGEGATPATGGRQDRCVRLEGAFALAILFAGEADLLICARARQPTRHRASAMARCSSAPTRSLWRR